MPQDIVTAPGLDVFKRGLERMMEEKSMQKVMNQDNNKGTARSDAR